MLVVTPLVAGAGAYFLDGPSPGRWLGEGARDLGVDGPVLAADLRRVLRGQHPGDGKHLGDRQRHRAGWDLTFAAPKSVSLLAALGPPAAGSDLAAAHRQAVDEALGFLVHHGCWARRGPHLVGITGPVMAAWDHVRSASGDPHLHCHVLVANLAHGTDGRWSALASDALWRCQRELGAVYRLALRHHLAEADYRFAWVLHANALADVGGVPRPAIDAVSARHHDVVAALAQLEQPNRRARRATRARTRDDGERRWRSAVEATGFGVVAAADLLQEARRTPARLTPDADWEQRVRAALERGASSFTTFDVIRALAATFPDGSSAVRTEALATRFCRTCVPVAAPEGHAPARWTTPVLQAADAELLRLALAGGGDDVDRGRDDRETVTGTDGRGDRGISSSHVAAAIHARPGLSPLAADAVDRLCTGPEGVRVLKGAPRQTNLMAHAAVLDAVRHACDIAGVDVAVASSSTGARRWDVLAGLPRHDPAGRSFPHMLVVDQSDRRTSAELVAQIRAARHGGTKRVVLVEGGTMPARQRPLSAGLVDAGRQLGRILTGPEPRLHPSPDEPGIAIGLVAIPPSTGEVLGDLGTRWAAAWARSHPSAPGLPVVAAGNATPSDNSAPREVVRGPVIPATLVGLGPSEVEALNRAARAHLLARGWLDGPSVELAGRTYQPGDRVVALRRGSVPAGALGWVTDVDPASRRIAVSWCDGSRADHRSVIDRSGGNRVAHGYALTPAQVTASARVAGTQPGDLFVLGPPSALRQHRHQVQAAAVVWRAAAPRVGGPPPSRLERLAEQALAASPPATGPAQRGVGDDRALATLPLDRLDAERDAVRWQLQHALPAGPAHPPQPDARWIASHAGELRHLGRLTRAAEYRTAALVRAVEVDPETPGIEALGRLQDRTAERPRWLGPGRGIDDAPGRGPDIGLGLG